MEKKKRDYIFLLVFMILSFISLTIIDKLSSSGFSHKVSYVSDGLTSVTVFLWYFFLYRVTSNFYQNKWIRGSYACLLIFQLTLNTYVNSQDHVLVSDLVVSASIAYLANLTSFGLVFYILLKDIFSHKHDLTYSLLGATNIYFMIPLLFCYLYSLVAVHNPSLVLADPLVIKTVLFHSFDYSWFVIAGIDYPGGKIGDVIQSMAILESIFSQLVYRFHYWKIDE